jgi:hypothetical protein
MTVSAVERGWPSSTMAVLATWGARRLDAEGVAFRVSHDDPLPVAAGAVFDHPASELAYRLLRNGTGRGFAVEMYPAGFRLGSIGSLEEQSDSFFVGSGTNPLPEREGRRR